MPSDHASSADRQLHEEARVVLAEKIDEIRGLMKASWPEMGAETGIAHQTLYAWAKGTYKGDIGRFNGEVERYLTARQERLKLGLTEAPGFVPTDTTERIQGLFRQAQHMPVITVIVGAPGVGKTQAAEDYRAENPNVVMITAAAKHGSARWLLGALGTEVNMTERGTSLRLLPMLVEYFRARRNPLIIADEANHLAMEAVELLRHLHDKAGCGIALVGNPTVTVRLNGSKNSEFAQITRRIGGRANVEKATKADAEKLLDAWKVEDPEVRKLLRATAARPGALGTMVNVLKLARILATPGGGVATADHIQQAHDQLSVEAG